MIRANEERLDIIDEEKTPYLFSSEYLIRMINEITPSVKTRVLIISLIGPRLTDPRARMQDIVVCFNMNTTTLPHYHTFSYCLSLFYFY
jgi:hypothetical protein